MHPTCQSVCQYRTSLAVYWGASGKQCDSGCTTPLSPSPGSGSCPSLRVSETHRRLKSSCFLLFYCVLEVILNINWTLKNCMIFQDERHDLLAIWWGIGIDDALLLLLLLCCCWFRSNISLSIYWVGEFVAHVAARHALYVSNFLLLYVKQKTCLKILTF